MKKLTTKIISFILTLTMVFSLGVPVFAIESYNYIKTSEIISNQQEIKIAHDAYFSLTPEAKEIFEKSLSNDPDMLKFHQTYIDKNFIPSVPKIQTFYAAADPMTILMAELSGLGLPSAVLYSLKAMGAGMVAAIADGPLPFGDILLAAASASTVVVIAANWGVVSSKMSQISSAFVRAFANSANNVISAFNTLKSDAQKQAWNNSINSAIDNCDSNKQYHILQSKHNWNKLFPGPNGPNWSNIVPVLLKVLQNGNETHETGNQYIRTLIYQGQTVVVRFIKDAQGVVKYISTAWVK